LRRIVVIATALAVLGVAAVAYAATKNNTYKATFSFTTKKAGTPKKPVALGFTQNIKASGTLGNRTAVLSDIKTKVYGMKSDGKDFPVCSFKTISNAKSDAGCPKGAEVATGFITAVLGSGTDFKAVGQACDPTLHVWNGGQGKLTFFFVPTATHQCLGGAIQAGQVGPYPATYKEVGKFLVTDVPVPKYIDYPVGPALAGSLETEHLVWVAHKAKVHGKTVLSQESVGCQGKKRPYSYIFTAALPNQPAQKGTVTGSGPCKG
jgi:hypothetical protein